MDNHLPMRWAHGTTLYKVWSWPASVGTLAMKLATVNPLVDGSQQNLGLTSDSSQFVCHRIECAQRV